MGGYENINAGDPRIPETGWTDKLGYLWVPPAEFARVFPLCERFAPDNLHVKTTRCYFFMDTFAPAFGREPLCCFLVQDYKQTRRYDSHLPSYDEFWSSNHYTSFQVYAAPVGQPLDSRLLLFDDFQSWVYRTLNEQRLEREPSST